VCGGGGGLQGQVKARCMHGRDQPCPARPRPARPRHPLSCGPVVGPSSHQAQARAQARSRPRHRLCWLLQGSRRGSRVVKRWSGSSSPHCSFPPRPLLLRGLLGARCCCGGCCWPLPAPRLSGSSAATAGIIHGTILAGWRGSGEGEGERDGRGARDVMVMLLFHLPVSGARERRCPSTCFRQDLFPA
jgi:hypothetical protein